MRASTRICDQDHLATLVARAARAEVQGPGGRDIRLNTYARARTRTVYPRTGDPS